MQIITTFYFLNGFAMVIEFSSEEFNNLNSMIKNSPEVFYDENFNEIMLDFGIIKLPFNYFSWESFIDNENQSQQFVILCKRVNDVPCRACFTFNLTKELYLEARAIEKTVRTFLKSKKNENASIEKTESLIV